MGRYFVTVWTAAGETSEPVFLTFSGVDSRYRVWTAPAVQLNQQATESASRAAMAFGRAGIFFNGQTRGGADMDGSVTVPLTTALPGYFEIYAQNVSTPATVRLKSSAAWRATFVRVQLLDSAQQSQTFQCSQVWTGRRGT